MNFNVIALYNYFVGVLPYVPILLCALGIKNKVLMLISFILPLLNCLKSILQKTLHSFEYIKENAFSAFIYTHGISLISAICGAAGFVFLILYILNIYKSKSLGLIFTAAHFGIALFFKIISIVSSFFDRYTSDFLDKYALFFNSINLLGLLISALALLIWIVYIKNEVFE